MPAILTYSVVKYTDVVYMKSTRITKKYTNLCIIQQYAHYKCVKYIVRNNISILFGELKFFVTYYKGDQFDTTEVDIIYKAIAEHEMVIIDEHNMHDDVDQLHRDWHDLNILCCCICFDNMQLLTYLLPSCEHLYYDEFEDEMIDNPYIESIIDIMNPRSIEAFEYLQANPVWFGCNYKWSQYLPLAYIIEQYIKCGRQEDIEAWLQIVKDNDGFNISTDIDDIIEMTILPSVCKIMHKYWLLSCVSCEFKHDSNHGNKYIPADIDLIEWCMNKNISMSSKYLNYLLLYYLNMGDSKSAKQLYNICNNAEWDIKLPYHIGYYNDSCKEFIESHKYNYAVDAYIDVLTTNKIYSNNICEMIDDINIDEHIPWKEHQRIIRNIIKTSQYLVLLHMKPDNIYYYICDKSMQNDAFIAILNRCEINEHIYLSHINGTGIKCAYLHMPHYKKYIDNIKILDLIKNHGVRKTAQIIYYCNFTKQNPDAFQILIDYIAKYRCCSAEYLKYIAYVSSLINRDITLANI